MILAWQIPVKGLAQKTRKRTNKMSTCKISSKSRQPPPKMADILYMVADKKSAKSGHFGTDLANLFLLLPLPYMQLFWHSFPSNNYILLQFWPWFSSYCFRSAHDGYTHASRSTPHYAAHMPLDVLLIFIMLLLLIA